MRAFASLLDGFGPVTKVFLFVGFIVLIIGGPSGFTLYNRTLMIGTMLLMAGLASHYWPVIKTSGVYFDGERTRGEVLRGKLSLAILFSILCATSAYFVYRGH